MRGHKFSGLARSDRSASALRERGIEPVMGDSANGEPGTTHVREGGAPPKPDVVVSTASVAASGDKQPRPEGEGGWPSGGAHDSRGALVFTSGSAVLGVSTAATQPTPSTSEDARAVPEIGFAPSPRACTLVRRFWGGAGARVRDRRARLADGDVSGVGWYDRVVYGHGGNSTQVAIERGTQGGSRRALGKRGTTQSVGERARR